MFTDWFPLAATSRALTSPFERPGCRPGIGASVRRGDRRCRTVGPLRHNWFAVAAVVTYPRMRLPFRRIAGCTGSSCGPIACATDKVFRPAFVVVTFSGSHCGVVVGLVDENAMVEDLQPEQVLAPHPGAFGAKIVSRRRARHFGSGAGRGFIWRWIIADSQRGAFPAAVLGPVMAFRVRSGTLFQDDACRREDCGCAVRLGGPAKVFDRLPAPTQRAPGLRRLVPTGGASVVRKPVWRGYQVPSLSGVTEGA